GCSFSDTRNRGFLPSSTAGQTPNSPARFLLVALKTLIGRNIPISDILPQAGGAQDLPDYFE
ncbi:MAG: hypothetical protein D3917_12595, partial [Candidatus Electrothrix sp. AX5]|nr:hypothetical protein [Candidatus Electrothrix sp. AX5]